MTLAPTYSFCSCTTGHVFLASLKASFKLNSLFPHGCPFSYWEKIDTHLGQEFLQLVLPELLVGSQENRSFYLLGLPSRNAVQVN